MTSRAQKNLLAGLVLAGLLAMAWDSVTLPDAQDRVSRLATAGLGFTSRELPLNETEKSIYGAAQVTKRIYRAGHENFEVIIIDGARNRHAVHDPAYCFRGAGWDITGDRPLNLPGGAGKILTLQKNGETRQAVFWFSDGLERHAQVSRCWWWVALRKLTFGSSGPAPVLVLVQPLNGGETDWELLPVQLPGLFEL